MEPTQPLQPTRKLRLPNLRDQAKPCFVISNCLSANECAAMIAAAESRGFIDALVNVGGGVQVRDDSFRNSKRSIYDSEEEAGKIFARIERFLPGTWHELGSTGGRLLVGLNERLRYLRYDAGEKFAPHYDGQYRRPADAGSAGAKGDRSFLTCMIYLNDDFEGGGTNFLGDCSAVKETYVPQAGDVVIFQHNILHEGAVVTKGRKYCIRTDVMYSNRQLKPPELALAERRRLEQLEHLRHFEPAGGRDVARNQEVAVAMAAVDDEPQLEPEGGPGLSTPLEKSSTSSSVSDISGLDDDIC